MTADVAYTDQSVRVARADRGSTAVFHFAGACTPGLVDWLGKALRELKEPAALVLRELTGVEETFFQSIPPRHKHPIVLIDPPPLAGDRFPILSCIEALAENGSISDSFGAELKVLGDLASRVKINPLWRRTDQDGWWICPFCGGSVENAAPENTRALRAHLLARCTAWKSGRRTPLPASVLDAFVSAINKRKSSAETERRRVMTQQIESLKEIERSVTQAKHRQLHLLPVDPDPDPVAEIEVVYRPLQAIGGDFLDFYPLPDNRFGVAIGDVSGHGVEAAIIMGMAKMALRQGSTGDIWTMMTQANRALYAELKRVAFVTAFAASIDRTTRRMTYIRAGHTMPLLRRGSTCQVLEGNGLPLGADAGPRFEAILEGRAIDLAAGDLLLLYTDGVIEAKEFGIERLKEAFLAAPAESVLPAVTASLDQFLGGAPVDDDVTLICLRIK